MAATTWTFDLSHSSVNFHVRHLMVSKVHGRFQTWDGTLVIDDDDNMRENIAELLRMEKYEVMTAEDGERGIELAIQRGPDLIVCDVTMPGMDGFQVFEVLSGQPGTAVVPFIFLSARSERTDVRRGMALGADDFITKPFARMELLGSISARLRRRER